jgi:hypothetical protein
MRRARQRENYYPVILSRDVSREASRQRNHFDEPAPVAEPEPVFVPESAFEPDSAPVAFRELGNASHAEVISLDAMRSGPPSYQAEDLDVPAFLRKRNDVM